MKKSILFLPVLILTLIFGACGIDLHNQLKSNVSETCTCYFVGETNDYYVNLFSGEREKTYKLDGISTQSTQYALLSVKCKTKQDNNEIQFSIEINNETTEGVLSANPFDNTIEADIQKTLNCDDEIYVYIKCGDNTQVANLKCISKDFFVNSDTVLDVAIDEVLNQNTQFDPNKKYECFIQVLNKDDSAHQYFWIVSIVSSEGDVYNIIIDTTSGKVLAKNSNNL